MMHYYMLLVLTIILSLSSQTGKAHRSLINADSTHISVIDHGYHTSIAVPAEAGWYNMNDSFPLLDSVEYLEFAWGDRDFYMHEGFSLLKGIKALFWPTSSVTHVTGFNVPPGNYFSDSEIYEVRISHEEFMLMYGYISRSMTRNEDGKYVFLKEGLYGESGFYASDLSYHLLFNCNNWIARALEKAGVKTLWWSGWPDAVTRYLEED